MTIDPRAIPALAKQIAPTLPDLAAAILAAAEADPAFRTLCRREGVEGGVGAAFDAARQTIEEAR